jgi:hypothetical protein
MANPFDRSALSASRQFQEHIRDTFNALILLLADEADINIGTPKRRQLVIRTVIPAASLRCSDRSGQ